MCFLHLVYLYYFHIPTGLERYPDKIPWKKSPQKIPLNAVERESVPTRVLNPNASEASYKPKQRSYRKTKLKKLLLSFYFSVGFWSGGFYPGTK